MFSLKGESNRTKSFTMKQYSVACVWLIVPTAVVHGREAKDRILYTQFFFEMGILSFSFMFFTANIIN